MYPWGVFTHIIQGVSLALVSSDITLKDMSKRYQTTTKHEQARKWFVYFLGRILQTMATVVTCVWARCRLWNYVIFFNLYITLCMRRTLWCAKLTHGPLARYVKLWFAHAPGMPGTFSPPPRDSDPDMHQGTCVAHMAWCMPGSLTSGEVGGGKTFPAFPAHAHTAI